MAHRWSYQKLVGPIPEGMVLDHKCHNDTDCLGGTTCPHRACVNPAHVEPKTIAENVANSHRTGVKMTHCKRGHEFTPENTIIRKNGWRNCRKCSDMSRKKYAEKSNTTNK